MAVDAPRTRILPPTAVLPASGVAGRVVRPRASAVPPPQITPRASLVVHQALELVSERSAVTAPPGSFLLVDPRGFEPLTFWLPAKES
jgi:hypothetical protein